MDSSVSTSVLNHTREGKRMKGESQHYAWREHRHSAAALLITWRQVHIAVTELQHSVMESVCALCVIT